jgi:hypothetical protein
MNVNTEPEYEIILTDKYYAIKSGTPNFEDLLFSAVNAILNEAKHIEEGIAEEKNDKHMGEVAHGALFDMMNIAFSNALHTYDPDVDLHPELTPESMLEEENKRLDEALANEDQVTFNELMKGSATSFEEIQELSEVPGTTEESTELGGDGV